ncbi:signal peptidase I [Chloroflexota bacterium]
MKKIAWYSVLGLVVLFMAVAVFIYASPRIGWHVNAVLSGSMEPALEVGSLVVTRPVEPEEVEVGDIITFRPVSVGEHMITHRVIGIGKNSPLNFRTQGDASDKPDPFTVPAQNLVGKICLHIPYWGYFTEFLKSPVGFVFSIVIPGILLFVLYIVSIWRMLFERKKQGADDKVVVL